MLQPSSLTISGPSRFQWASNGLVLKKSIRHLFLRSGDEALKTGVVTMSNFVTKSALYFLICLTRLTIFAVTNCHWSDASSLATSVEVLRATLSQEFMTGLASKRAAHHEVSACSGRKY